MLETLFGAEMPLAVRFFLAFLIVLGLIGATAWAVRRFGAGRLGGASTRGRQPRLAVIDYASVDGRRRLVLVRRDNVEHLLIIGGPTDVVVEPNIVRGARAEAPAPRPSAGIEALPRAIPLPENGNGGTWPLQPEPTGGPRAPRLEAALQEELARPFAPPAEPPPPPRPQRDTLAALADELSARPVTPPRRQPARPQGDEPHHEPHHEARGEKSESRAEPRKSAPPVMPPPLTPAPAPAETAASPDQSLADMAQRLEAALRKSPPEPRPPAAPARGGAAAAAEPAAPKPARPDQSAEARSAKAEAKPAPAKEGKSALYDNLEQEMASLLGRPTKT